MSLEQQVIALTEATEQLLEAVNTRKADLDTAETNASLSAQIAASAEQNVLSAAEMVNIQSGLVLQAVNNPGLIAVGEDLTTSNTIGTVATDINAIAIVAQNISDVTLLADVTAVAENIADIETTVDNLPSILAASTNATKAAASAQQATSALETILALGGFNFDCGEPSTNYGGATPFDCGGPV